MEARQAHDRTATRFNDRLNTDERHQSAALRATSFLRLQLSPKTLARTRPRPGWSRVRGRAHESKPPLLH